MQDSQVLKGGWATLAAAVVILASGCSTSGVGIAQQDDPSQPLRMSAAEPGPGSVATPESVPHFTVTAPRTHPTAQRNLQKWADDVADGDLATLTRKCWTFAPERIAAMYSDPGAIAAAMTTPSEGAQAGTLWRVDGAHVSVSHAELRSDYPCPTVELPGRIDLGMRDYDAAHVVTRFLHRAAGSPVASTDTESNYPLDCGPVASSAWEREAPSGVRSMEHAAREFGRIGGFEAESVSATVNDDRSLALVTATVDGRETTFYVLPHFLGRCVISFTD